ncbi:MAG TPA: NAD(P)-dependent oxidoreductase [Candidatus Cloacimonetes bacterium]|nr:NAD(P)-dependent oxidoreductase [Candidatus Cloacimonadota bacterium]
MAKLLITGITGFIGGSILESLLEKDHEITALIRPDTAPQRYARFEDKIELAAIDLANIKGIRDFLQSREFDTILHIGALRGGRKASKEEFYLSNIGSTKELVDYAQERKAKLLFCSSVGVFGAIPEELPANRYTQKIADNYYHYTKIECEKMIGKAARRGLHAAIIRPAITYGKGDYGFPYQLVKMVDKGYFPMINKRIWVHLCHIDALVNAFDWCVGNSFKSGLTLNVADRDPVELGELVNFISNQTRGRDYPRFMKTNPGLFALGEQLSRALKNELFISRFELISKSWFFDVSDYYKLMTNEDTKIHHTIPDIQITIDDYLRK